MPYTVEQLPGEAIIRVVFTNPVDFQHDIDDLLAQLLDIAKDIPGSRAYVIYDVRGFKIGFSELVMALAAALRPSKSDLAWDTRIRGAVVGATGLLKLGFESAKQAQYGGINFEPFNTFEEAVAFAREQIAQEAAS